MNEKQRECRIETCDIFDFMAHHVGMTVIHPGGFDSGTGKSSQRFRRQTIRNCTILFENRRRIGYAGR
jgi:hypothetical protein